MAEGGIEEAVEKVVHKSTTRRNLLRWGAKAAGTGLVAATIGLSSEEDHDNPRLNTSSAKKISIPKPPENLPEDVITPEELKRFNISINPTQETQLYLHRSALDLKIFKDAVEGKSGGVVISLVDNNTLTWNATDKLPPDARLMWQAKEVHPSEYPNWEQYFKIKEKKTEELIKYWQKELNDIASGKAEMEILKSIKSYSDAESERDRERLEYWQKQLEDLRSGRREPEIKEFITLDQKKLEDIQELKGTNRQGIIQHFLNVGTSLGEHVNGQLVERIAMTDETPDPMDLWFPYPFKIKRTRTRYNYIRNHHPSWLKKTYLYVCVGNGKKPHPNQSFLGPDDFEVSEDDKKAFGYHVKVKRTMPSSTYTPGFTLRHELGHYGNNPDQEFVEREAGADDFALQSLLNAWQKYQQNGDTSGYSFIFATPEGLTFTKNQITTKPGAV